MNTLSEPPSYPSPSRQYARVTYVKHPVFRRLNTFDMTTPRPLRRALPCPAF